MSSWEALAMQCAMPRPAVQKKSQLSEKSPRSGERLERKSDTVELQQAAGGSSDPRRSDDTAGTQWPESWRYEPNPYSASDESQETLQYEPYPYSISAALNQKYLRVNAVVDKKWMEKTQLTPQSRQVAAETPPPLKRARSAAELPPPVAPPPGADPRPSSLELLEIKLEVDKQVRAILHHQVQIRQCLARVLSLVENLEGAE